jgi:multiple sugar transport system ATP-binding protein
MGSRIAVMSAGELQQIDTPFNLYHNPRNLFVAGFMGSPSMNFLDATLATDANGTLSVTGNGFSIPVPTSNSRMYAGVTGKSVIFGIRPEDIHDAEFLPANITPAYLDARVDVVEQMGNEMILYLMVEGKTLLARTDPRTRAATGNTLRIAFNMDNVHLFDKDSELSMSYESKNAAALPLQQPVAVG